MRNVQYVRMYAQQTSSSNSTVTPPQEKRSPAAPIRNLRDAVDALDAMIEEAERKLPKKYRPNMFAEFKQLNDTEGKVIEAAGELTSVHKAVKVPSLKAKNLVGEEIDMEELVAAGKVTLLLTSFKNFGMNMLPAWRDAFNEIPVVAADAKRHHFDVVMLNVIEDWYMKLVQGSITRGLCERTPEAMHGRTLAHFGRCDDFRTVLDLNNSFVGYAHLIDGKGRVRWMAAGDITRTEKKTLAALTAELASQSHKKERRA